MPNNNISTYIIAVFWALIAPCLAIENNYEDYYSHQIQRTPAAELNTYKSKYSQLLYGKHLNIDVVSPFIESRTEEYGKLFGWVTAKPRHIMRVYPNVNDGYLRSLSKDAMYLSIVYVDETGVGGTGSMAPWLVVMGAKKSYVTQHYDTAMFGLFDRITDKDSAVGNNFFVIPSLSEPMASIKLPRNITNVSWSGDELIITALKSVSGDANCCPTGGSIERRIRVEYVEGEYRWVE